MTTETHFVQAGDDPVLIGSGSGTLECACGNRLVQGFDPACFVAIGIRCARCGSVTTTPSLAEGRTPPRSAFIAAPSEEPRTAAATLPRGTVLLGQGERDRLHALFRPATPDNLYRVSTGLLDEAVAEYEARTGQQFPLIAADDPPVGLRVHALGWAVQHLRLGLRATPSPPLSDPATANAVSLVTGFLHFCRTWSRHPLFPAMLATAGERGFCLHGLARFAAAHCLLMMGNPVQWPEVEGFPGRIERFDLASTPTDPVGVHFESFGKFEFPFGDSWNPAGLVGAVSGMVAAVQGRINVRHPGILLLSPGAALAGFDEALIQAIKAALQNEGRRNRGLIAVAPIVLRLQAMPDPTEVRFGYGIFPVLNRHYRGETPTLTAS